MRIFLCVLVFILSLYGNYEADIKTLNNQVEVARKNLQIAVGRETKRRKAHRVGWITTTLLSFSTGIGLAIFGGASKSENDNFLIPLGIVYGVCSTGTLAISGSIHNYSKHKRIKKTLKQKEHEIQAHERLVKYMTLHDNIDTMNTNDVRKLIADVSEEDSPEVKKLCIEAVTRCKNLETRLWLLHELFHWKEVCDRAELVPLIKSAYRARIKSATAGFEQDNIALSYFHFIGDVQGITKILRKTSYATYDQYLKLIGYRYSVEGRSFQEDYTKGLEQFKARYKILQIVAEGKFLLTDYYGNDIFYAELVNSNFKGTDYKTKADNEWVDIIFYKAGVHTYATMYGAKKTVKRFNVLAIK